MHTLAGMAGVLRFHRTSSDYGGWGGGLFPAQHSTTSSQDGQAALTALLLSPFRVPVNMLRTGSVEISRRGERLGTWVAVRQTGKA